MTRKCSKYSAACCDKCYTKIKFIEQPYCYSCGKPLFKEEQEYCSDCLKFRKSFLNNRSLLLYNDKMQESLLRFKFHNRREYALFYADELVKRYGKQLLSWDVDGLIPVPVHREKYIQRGYNQAGLVAKEMGRYLKLPVYENKLLRYSNTKAQKELNPAERLKNLEKAFHFEANGVKLNKIVLIDDIYTTGATMEACSRVLNAAGIDTVYGITIAIGQGY